MDSFALELIAQTVITGGLITILAGAVLALIEKLGHWDDKARRGSDPMACATYGGLKLVAWAILIAGLMR